WLLARVEFPGRAVLRGVVTLPLVLPPAVGGAALLFALGRRGLLGGALESATGLLLPFSVWGVIAASTFGPRPFMVIRGAGGGCTAGDGLPLRRCRVDVGGGAVDHGPPGHPSDDRTLPEGGSRPHLGARVRRVRCDDHLRREPPGSNADAAARRLRGAGE